LEAVNWFDYDKKCQEDIRAGNSRVLVEANNNEFWVDSNNTRKDSSDPTIYIKKSITKYTKSPIYPGGSRVFNLIDWYFQYISENDDHCKLTAFVVSGYKPELSCELTMASKTPFRYFADGYNFFAAVGSDDVYLTTAARDHKGKYNIWSGLLSRDCRDAKSRAQVQKDFASALLIVYHHKRLYILTADRFVIYGACDEPFQKLYEAKLAKPVTCNDDLEDVLQDQMNNCRHGWAKYDNDSHSVQDNHSNRDSNSKNSRDTNSKNSKDSNSKNFKDSNSKNSKDSNSKNSNDSNSKKSNDRNSQRDSEIHSVRNIQKDDRPNHHHHH